MLPKGLTWLGIATLVAVSPAPAAAQRAGRPNGFYPRWEIPGFDFSRNGVWRGRARQVRALRARLLAQRQFSSLNAAAALGGSPFGSPVVSGTIVEPVILFKYQDTQAAAILGDTTAYDSVLFAVNPPLGRPYTVRTYYEELSTLNGNAPLITVKGKALGFVALSKNEVAYTGIPGTCSGNPTGTTNCNGIFSSAAVTQMQNGFREALTALDNSVDWTQFSSHGDTLDLVVFIQPAMDGACGGTSNNHIWAHRYQLEGLPYTTHSGLKVVDYIVQSGVGGSAACDTAQIMPPGTVAHETGHGFDLPDLYDTQGTSEGVGEWSLMGSGNYRSPLSPARMDAWCLSQLGWVTVAPLTVPGTYSFSAAPVSDTTYYVRPTGSNPRGEYFLLENRQKVQSDSALIRAYGPGLLIWHVDSTQIANRGFNQDNAVDCQGSGMCGPFPGLELMQADGLRNLDIGPSRGDAGDPYPGASGNTVFSYNTNPAARKNVDSSFVGFAIDSITQVVLNGTMSFRLRFGGLTVVRSTDTTAVVTVDGNDYNVFRNFLDSGSVHNVSITSPQLVNTGRTRDSLISWSNGQPNPQTYTAKATADTLTANLARSHKLVYAPGANGTINSGAAPASGSFVAQGTAVTLIAVPSGSFAFAGWTGDTSTTNTTLALGMAHPYSVTANFGTALVISSAATRPGGTMGTPYLDTLKATGGTGSFSWQAVGTMPAGLSLATTGVVSGTPNKTGTFSYQATVTSGLVQQTQTFSVTTVAPTLATLNVVNQILNGGSTLSATDLTYLDLLGNGNFSFDVGDFLAWVMATGAP